jgi:hypothetical protein
VSIADGTLGPESGGMTMSESETNPDDPRCARTPHSRPRLMPRAMRERWPIPGSLRRPLVERLAEIILDRNAAPRDVLMAVSGILTASKINLANMALTIKVQTHEELEERMSEIERTIDARSGESGGHG